MLNYNKKSPEMVERFLKRLLGTEGNISLAATSIGLAKETIRTWRKRDKNFDEQIRTVLAKVNQQ